MENNEELIKAIKELIELLKKVKQTNVTIGNVNLKDGSTFNIADYIKDEKKVDQKIRQDVESGELNRDKITEINNIIRERIPSPNIFIRIFNNIGNINISRNCSPPCRK
ncbi:MAG: hypothetical protein K8T10_13225 [Candidatus Eremiobacteraeota bacterium]|nr:hypothetical protein [Candidatus Eremiobacteraeota bacterium]